MSSDAVQSHPTPEEYLALERKATIKSEYRNRSIHPMPRSNRAHNLVNGNICCELPLREIYAKIEFPPNDAPHQSQQAI